MTQDVKNLQNIYARSARRKELFNGRTKILFDGPEPGTLVLYFKDSLDQEADIQASNAHGALNNRFSELLMQRLNQIGVETHLIKRLNMREQLVRFADPLPFRFRVHNIAIDSLSILFNLEAGTVLSEPIIELYVKNTKGEQVVIAPQHVYSLGWAQEEELEILFSAIRRINDFLLGQFLALNLRLANYCLEFGRIFTQDFFEASKLILIDAFGLDSSSILDVQSGERLDSGVGVGTNWNGCKEVAKRFGLLEYLQNEKSTQEAA
ncbi:MAG: phosphoribosylaminoimidazolesuccinocarboxamide synthase [Pseudomonadota bacterium]|jgi:phosphoribosylaminoimidazole-succinocarboxamide synthase|nr:phosphoribosylaminoimidazolesuccinocarboxamide synthase [Alphaproteobacteria bacterium]